jgi:hypothetical protein
MPLLVLDPLYPREAIRQGANRLEIISDMLLLVRHKSANPEP